MEYYITRPADYWIAPNAVQITLNALGDKNRIQGSVASGAVIMCFVESIKAESDGGESGNGDGLWYGSNHEPKRWPLSLSPTYFNSDTHKYVYAAIPRSTTVGSQAVIVFPSEQLDIYGRARRTSTAGDGGTVTTYEQIGSTDYFYVYLNGIISAPAGTPEQRTWEDPITDKEWGVLETAQGREEKKNSSEWYTYSQVNQLVTFLREIVMNTDASFRNLIINHKNITDVATSNALTPVAVDADLAVATPGYVAKFYLSKVADDIAAGHITFQQGLQSVLTATFGSYSRSTAAVPGASPSGSSPFSASSGSAAALSPSAAVPGASPSGPTSADTGAAILPNGTGDFLNLKVLQKVLGNLSIEQTLDAVNMIFSGVLKSVGADPAFEGGKGIWLDALTGTGSFDGLEVRGFMRVMELIINRLQLMESDYSFTEGATVEHIDYTNDGKLLLWIRKEHDNDFLPFYQGDILYAKVNNLLPRGAVVPDGHTTTKNGSYYTVWMKVENTDFTDNTITVSLYGSQRANGTPIVPAGKNFTLYGSPINGTTSPSSVLNTEKDITAEDAADNKTVIAVMGTTLGENGYDTNITLTRHGNVADSTDAAILQSQKGRQQSWHLSTTDQRIIYYWRVDSPIVDEQNIALCLGMLPHALDGVLPAWRDYDKPGLYISQLYYEHAKQIRYPSKINKVDRGEWTANPTAVFDYDGYDHATWSPDNPPSTYVAGNGVTYGALAASYGTPGIAQTISTEQTINEPYHCKTMTKAVWLNARLGTTTGTDAEIEARCLIDEMVDLETSRAWHYGILWECLTDATTEEPSYGCSDWMEVGGDTSFRITLTDENGIAMGNNMLVERGSVSQVLKGVINRGQEDVSLKVNAWAWDIIEADGTEHANVASTRQLQVTDATLPASWEQSGSVAFRCRATVGTETLTAMLKMTNYDISSYDIEFSDYVDVITVDDVGNCIGGIYTVSGTNNEHRSYRIHSAITVRKNGTPLLFSSPSSSPAAVPGASPSGLSSFSASSGSAAAPSSTPAAVSGASPSGLSSDSDDAVAPLGHYKIYGEGHGCSFIIENSTLYITSIDNIKDGVPGTPDDVNFDYDAMRLMSSCSVDLLIDCEGVATMQKRFPVTIKHDSQPYVAAEISNPMSSVKWLGSAFAGLPIAIDITMSHNSEHLDIASADNISITPAITGMTIAKSIVTDDEGYKKGHIVISALPNTLGDVTHLSLTCSAVYSGVSYERTLTHTITRLQDGDNGISVESYIESQEAWGDSTTTPPQSGWSDSTPTKNGKYLWRRSRKMVLDSTGAAYEPDSDDGDHDGVADGEWKYQRLSGTDGTSINTRGRVADANKRGGIGGSSTTLNSGEAELINGTTITMSDGDSVVQQDDGHLYQWITEGGGQWLDLGQFKGDPGITYFTHIAWADSVSGTFSGSVPAGQISTPNKGVVGNFSIAPQDGYDWMGLLINQTESDPTSSSKTYYTWQYAKGAKGDDAVMYWLEPSTQTVRVDGTTTTPSTFSVKLMKTQGGVTSELTSLPQGLASGMSIEIYVDGTLEQTYDDYTSPAGFYEFFGQGASTAMFANCSYIEFRLRARTSQTVYDTKTITTVQSAVTYAVKPDVNSVNFRIDAVGLYNPGYADIHLAYTKTTGNDTTAHAYPAYPYTIDDTYFIGFRVIDANGVPVPTFSGTQAEGWDYTNNSKSIDTATYHPSNIAPGTIRVPNQTTATAIDVAVMRGPLNTATSANVVSVMRIPILFDGHNGRLFYPMGAYDNTTIYTLTVYRTPIVFFKSNTWNPALGCYGDYWFLKKSMTTAGHEPADNSEYWQRAESFGLVITQGIFAMFAKMAEFVMAGKWFYSTNGTINGTPYNEGRTFAATGIPAYTLFNQHFAAGNTTAELKRVAEATSTPSSTAWSTLTETFQMNHHNSYTIRVTGNVTGGTGYLCYAFDKGDTENTNRIAIGTIFSTTTMTVEKTITTPADADDYRLLFATDSANSTFNVEKVELICNTNNVFIPNLAFNGMTGEIYAAKGNFLVKENGNVEVKGTIRATNLYRNVCLFRQDENYSNDCYYCCVAPSVAFVVGQYYTEAEIYAKGSNPADTYEESDFYKPYFIRTTYDADVVVMVPNISRNNDGGWHTDRYDEEVLTPIWPMLPAPTDFVGKLVEISGWSRVNEEKNIHVGCVVYNAMSNGISFDNQGNFAFASASDEIAIKTGTVYKLLSMTIGNATRWVLLG